MGPAKAAPALRFEATLYAIGGPAILLLPGKAGNQLPSRGQVAVQATVNGRACRAVAEPDGEFGRWVRIDAKQQRAAALRAGDTAEVELGPPGDWPEPTVPHDLQAALAATRNPGTRQRRVEVGISKTRSGKRRPCCVNLGACTDPDLFEEREADQSAMIHLAYAVSEPCGPWGASLG